MDMLFQFIARPTGLNKKVFDSLERNIKAMVRYRKLLLILGVPEDAIKEFVDTKGDMYMRRYEEMEENAFINGLIQEVEEYEQTDEK